MTGAREERAGQPARELGSYEVGYRRPPKASRFQPGRSGNPNGRPKRRKVELGSDGGQRMTEQLIMAEMLRPVRVVENGKTVQITAFAAATRATMVAAMKGSRLHYKEMIEAARRIEEGRAAQHHETMRLALESKREWGRRLREAAMLGVPPPEPPIPHPDDIVVDLNTGEVEIRGPRTPDEKACYDAAACHRDTLLADLGSLGASTDDPTSTVRARLLGEIRAINQRLPIRYRRAP